MSATTVEAMSDRYEWVEIVEPRTQDHMYANLLTGECTWRPPSGVKIKKTCENDNQWWELYDNNTSRFYYYNASSQKTVWHKPQGCDIIPLAKLQNLKPVPDATRVSEEAEMQQCQRPVVQPVVQREMSTQTPVKLDKADSRSMCAGGSLTRTNTNPLQSNRHKHSKGSRTSVRGSDRSLIDPVKEGLDPAYNRLDSLPNNVHRKRNQRVAGKDEPRIVTLSDVKTSKTECVDDAHSKSCQHFEIQRTSDFAKLQRPEWHPKNSLPDGSFKIPRPYTASRSGQSGSTQRTAKAEAIDGLLLSPRLHSSRRTESQRMPSSVVSLLVKDSTIAQPQRSLESPKSLPPPSAADIPPVPPATGNNKPVNLKRSGMEVSWTSADVDPKFGVSGRGSSNNSHPLSRFQRQDSVPLLRDSSRLHSWQTSGQFQDVSQITAIQVTPRPKPRAFPRTNPSYVATQRRDWVVGGSYRKVSESNHQRKSPVDVIHQAYYNPGKDRVSSTYGGAQTLQASHLHYKDPVLAVEAKRAVLKNEDYDSDTTQSSTGSELNYQLHQRVLDSKVMRPRANQLVSSLRCSNTGVNQVTAFAAGTLAADCEVAAVMSSDLSSPVNSLNFLKSCKSGSYSTQFDLPPREKPKKATVSHREPVLMKHHRRNSEPDYVNVPSGKEERSASVSQMLKSHSNHQASTSPDRQVEDGLQSGGTLHHAKDPSSPSNLSDNFQESSDQSSALLNPSPQCRPRQAHTPSETHHPSLRRRKWLEKPVQQVPQSTLEKSLSLQAELTQHRPLSMIVPFGSDGNAIVSQVADSLLQQMDIERFVAENLNEHRKGRLGKAVPVSSLLVWTKDLLQKPMIRTENRIVKREASEVFRLIQVYMGDKKCRESLPTIALELLNKGWSCQELADEIFMQLCRQTTKNPRNESLLQGWELLGICLSFFGPSSKFHSFVDGHIFRTLDSRDHTTEGHIHNYAICCQRRLDRISQAGSKRKPSLEEVEHSKKSLLEPSMFGGTLESIMDLQKELYPDSKLPWIQTTLSEELLRLRPGQLTEGIFRVPGDSDEVNVLKARYDRWIPPTQGTDPHILASLLKLWYRELYEPLIPHNFYERCVDSCTDATSAVNVVAELPQLNKMVLSYLVLFLQKFALPEVVAVTKMDANNLAMVMAPNCLRCMSTDPQVLFNNARKEVDFMRLLIHHLDTSGVDGIVATLTK